jgi:hypothetical protein
MLKRTEEASGQLLQLYPPLWTDKTGATGLCGLMFNLLTSFK